MLRFDVQGMPDNLPRGTYATSVKQALWTADGDMLIVLEYAGGRALSDSLFKIQVEGKGADGNG